MKYLKIHLFLLFISGISFGKDVLLATAENYYNIGNYDLAITEYMRFIFFNPENDSISDIYYRIHLSYRNQGKYSEAIKALDESIKFASNDSISDEKIISKSGIYIADGEYSSAEFELLKISNFSKYSEVRKKAYFFLGICDLYTYKWKESQLALKKYFYDNPLIQNQLDSLFYTFYQKKYRSPILAKWLSTFVPGTGQIYGGDLKDGINALLLNSLTGYLLIDSIIENRIEDFIISYTSLFGRYYMGNRYKAEKATVNFNDQINKNNRDNVLNYINQINFSANHGLEITR